MGERGERHETSTRAAPNKQHTMKSNKGAALNKRREAVKTKQQTQTSSESEDPRGTKVLHQRARRECCRIYIKT